MSAIYLSPASPLMEAVRAIEISRRRIAVVLSEDEKLLGTLTDGDIRRCLLAGGSLDTPVSQAMNSSPITADSQSSTKHLLDLMRRGNILAIPLIQIDGRFDRLVHLTDIDNKKADKSEASEFAFAVIMAGGEGMRLRPITENIPKPMVDIGGVPLLERQIQRLANSGVRKVYLSVNYLSHVIEEYFGDGQKFGLEIQYLREKEKLGTAGALSLLPETPTRPIIVMNGDILTTFNFGSLYSFHSAHNVYVTVAAVDYRVNIPYGVINADGPYVKSLAEKPSQRFLCNAGIYALSPKALSLLSDSKFYNMTDIVETCITQDLPVAVFPVHEYWSDIGTHDDLAKARELFKELELNHE